MPKHRWEYDALHDILGGMCLTDKNYVPTHRKAYNGD